MKTKAGQASPGDKKNTQNNGHLLKNGALQTDLPLSEKDEVKQAERRTNKALRHHL